MPLISGTYVGSGLSPGNVLNKHETHRALYGKGGYRTVATTTERNQIPPLRREEGMLVYVVADGLVYKLQPGAPLTGDTNNGNWQIFTVGGGGPVVITGNINAGTYYDLVVGQTASFAIEEYKLSLISATKAYGEKILISKDHTELVVPGFSFLEYSILGQIDYSAVLLISGPDLILRITNNELVSITYTIKT